MENKNEQYILNSLDVIGSLKPGQTISSTSKKVINHNSWSGSAYRLWNREDRKKSLEYIENVVKCLKKEIENLPHTLNLYRAKIHQAINGLENLTLTYRDDCTTVGIISDYIVVLRNLITVKQSPIVIMDNYESYRPVERPIEKSVEKSVEKSIETISSKNSESSPNRSEYLLDVYPGVLR